MGKFLKRRIRYVAGNFRYSRMEKMKVCALHENKKNGLTGKAKPRGLLLQGKG